MKVKSKTETVLRKYSRFFPHYSNYIQNCINKSFYTIGRYKIGAIFLVKCFLQMEKNKKLTHLSKTNKFLATFRNKYNIIRGYTNSQPA